MLSCEQAQHLFDSYLNDELSSSLTSALDAHRLECPACQQQLSLLEACGNVVRLDTSEPRLADDFTERLMAILDAERRQHSSWPQLSRAMKWGGGLLGVAAAIAILLVGWSAWQPHEGADRSVAGGRVDPNTRLPAAGMITDLPLELIFDVTDVFSSTLELGQYGINHFHDTLSVDGPPPLPDFVPLPTPDEPDWDVLDTLPDLDDGGELL